MIKNNKIDVSIVIPVHNEKEAIRECVIELKNKMDSLGCKYEIIVVDDASNDGSLDEISDLDVKVVSFQTRRGGGEARVEGMYHAKGDIILQTDADGTYPVDKIGEILKLMESSDMVIGARIKETQKDFYIIRIFMKWFIKKIAELLVNQKIPDLNSGLRAYKKKIALKYRYLYPPGHSIMSTMTIAFLSEGYNVAFVPIDYRKRIGRTSFHIIKDTYNYLQVTISTVAFFKPLRLLMPIALMTIVFAIVFTIRDIFRLGLGPLTALLWLIAVLIVILAIISEQIMRLAKYISYLSYDEGSFIKTSSKE